MNSIRLRLISALVFHTAREQMRNRSYQVTLLFSGLLLYISLVLGAMAVEEEIRTLLDFGLSFIELMAVVVIAYGSATNILREIETKTIYLILTRPVPRAAYLLGRSLGLWTATACAVLAMAVVHVVLLSAKGWHWQWTYWLGILGILLKTALISALVSFVALWTTSVLSTLTITGIVWTLGHFLPELEYLIRRTAHHWAQLPLYLAMYLLPDLRLLNFRDRLGVPAHFMPNESLALGVGYAVSYAAVCLVLAYALLRRKEF